LGLLVFFFVGRVRAFLNTAGARSWGPDQGSDQFLALLDHVSRTIVGLLQSGRLRVYVTMTLVTLAVALGVPVLAYDLMPTSFTLPPAPFYVYGVLGLTVTGALALMFARSRLQAILSMGVTGVSVALLFLLFGAPDLAYTQFMVETLSVVIIALVLLRLPVDTYDSRHILPSLRDAAIAGAVGVFFTALLIAITAGPLDLSLTDYFAANSYVAAHGHNIVNVILVDFRALDTLGEISVVMVAGLAALALIKIRRGKLVPPDNGNGGQDTQGGEGAQ
jgi:multicomponent Na+:H+ antiporter subunit A